MDTDKALAPLTQAQRMLAEAVTLQDFRDIRDMSETALAYAKARGLGIEAENTASEYVLRAERGMGKALIKMAENGERATLRSFHGNKYVDRADSAPSTLMQLIDAKSPVAAGHLSRNFQALARLWTDEEFEERLSFTREIGARIAKVNFYRGPQAADKRQAQAFHELEEELAAEDATPAFAAFEKAATAITSAMQSLPNDELAKVAGIIRQLAESYNAAKGSR